jgi:hypothetical protein
MMATTKFESVEPTNNALIVRVQDTKAVARLLKVHNTLDAAKALVDQGQESITLGGVLWHIYYEGTFKLAGYDGKRGFAAYVKTELGLSYRKAMDLINLYVICRGVGVDEKLLGKVRKWKGTELAAVLRLAREDEAAAEAIGSLIWGDRLARNAPKEVIGAPIATAYKRMARRTKQRLESAIRAVQ